MLLDDANALISGLINIDKTTHLDEKFGPFGATRHQERSGAARRRLCASGVKPSWSKHSAARSSGWPEPWRRGERRHIGFPARESVEICMAAGKQ
jgi:hypothetical protein